MKQNEKLRVAAQQARIKALEMQLAALNSAQKVGERTRQQAKRVREHTLMHVERAKKNARFVRDTTVRLFRINLANTLTLFNGVCGFLSILATIHEQYFIAAILILLGVLFDWLDGKAARAFSETSALGAELDSLSDFVSFGVAPAVFVAIIAPSWFSYGAGALFVLSAAVRLGRFNVQQTKGVYFGVPTTANGIFLPAMILLGAPVYWFMPYLVLMALLMNAPIKIKKMF